MEDKIEIVVDIRTPQVDLRLPADGDSLPIVRQALRSLGEAVRADRDALEDAELAVTEACTNVVEHAYGEARGMLEVSFAPRPTEMVVTVRDEGGGISPDTQPGAGRGYGLSMIQGIANRLEVSPREGGGTGVMMWLDMGGERLSLNGSSPPAAAPLERLARRIVAVVAAQADMPADRFVESLLAVELATRHAPGYLTGDKVRLTLERLEGGFDLCIGPLVADGANALVHESELPVVGAIIERLSDEVGVETTDSEPGGERLRLLIGSGSG